MSAGASKGPLGLLRAARVGLANLAGRPPMRFPPYAPAVVADVRRQWDDVRYGTLALALQRLDTDRVPGAIAEVGVFRGHTSRFLSHAAPHRELHLFDTFEGFPMADREPENAGDTRFTDTSEALVRAIVGERKGVHIHRGRFPETAAGLEHEMFALVMLDLDVYPPTKAGLEFFYPRVPRGGYVFVHDYNSPESNRACSRAVDEFLADKPERAIEIPDQWGSVVFRRS